MSAPTFSSQVAGFTVFFCLLWLTWAVFAPIIAGPVKLPPMQHNCPDKFFVHGVGGNLKTYVRVIDKCSE